MIEFAANRIADTAVAAEPTPSRRRSRGRRVADRRTLDPLVPDGFDVIAADVFVNRRIEARDWTADKTLVGVVLSQDESGGRDHGSLMLDLQGVECVGTHTRGGGASFELSPAHARALFGLLRNVAAAAVLQGVLPAEASDVTALAPRSPRITAERHQVPTDPGEPEMWNTVLTIARPGDPECRASLTLCESDDYRALKVEDEGGGDATIVMSAERMDWLTDIAMPSLRAEAQRRGLWNGARA